MYTESITLLLLDKLYFHVDMPQLDLSWGHIMVNSSLLDQQSRRDERYQNGI